MVWVVKYHPSYEYFTFNDVITRLDAVGSIHSSNRDFLDEKYHALRGMFDNEVTSRVLDLFVRELPTIFGRAESFSSSVTLSSIRPLPVIKSYDAFNTLSTHSGIKYQIND